MELEISEEKQQKLMTEFKSILNKLEPLENEETTINNINQEEEQNDIVKELKNTLTKRDDGKKDFPKNSKNDKNDKNSKNDKNDKNSKNDKNTLNKKKDDSKNIDFIISMLSSASNKTIISIVEKIINVSDAKLLDHLHKLLGNAVNPCIKKKANGIEDLDMKNIIVLCDRLKKYVEKIDSILEKDSWDQQEEKTNTLQHQVDSHRSFLFNHNLGFINKNSKRAECVIDKIPGINYFKFIKNGEDLINDYEDPCNCMDYTDVSNCNICSQMRDGIASRSCGLKYEKNKIPKWNITFAAGALRSKNRVFYGTYKVRARSRLTAGCSSFITFSMMLPVKDQIIPNSGYWEEIALGFNQQFKNRITLFIKSDISPTLRKKVLIPIEIKDSKFNRAEYNNYTLQWHKNEIKLAVNGKNVYSSAVDHPVPQLPGYSYFIVRPNFDTNSSDLLKTIKKNIGPDIKINSFTYIPDF